MPTKDEVVKVWIDPGCIACDVCETTAPTIFQVTGETCIIRPEAMTAAFTRPATDVILSAASQCPVDVIKFEAQPFEITVAAPSPAPAAPRPSAPAKAPSPAAVAAEQSGDPNIRKLLETSKARGGVAGVEKNAPLAPAAQYRESPVSKLPPDARFMRMIDAGKEAASKPAAASKDPSRRDVIKLTAWASFSGAMAVGTYGCGLRFMFPNVLNEPEKRIRVAAMDKFREMAPGSVNEEWKNKGFWIVRVEDQIAALSTTCTHLGCIPSWLEADKKFKCPCHGSGFKQEGINFEGPAPRPLERFKVTIEDGYLIVDKGRKFQYEKGEWENPESFLAV